MSTTILFPYRVRNTLDYNVIEENREHFAEERLIIVHEENGDHVMGWEQYKKEMNIPEALYNIMPGAAKNLIRSVDVEDYLKLYIDSLVELCLFFINCIENGLENIMIVTTHFFNLLNINFRFGG